MWVRRRIVVLAQDGLLPMELGIVHRLFGQATDARNRRYYDVLTCTPRPGHVRTDADVAIVVEHGLGVLAGADTVVVLTPRRETASEPPPDEVLDALAGLPPATRIASICRGAFVLGWAGLLDGRRATTHWNWAARFRSLFPEALLDESLLYTEDRGVLTSAGVASGIDLCLHMIRSDHGRDVANEVARGTVVPPHRDGGQALYVRRDVGGPAVSSTARARAWALENLDRPITLAEMAAAESSSTRSFTRRFRDEMGTSPGRWLAAQRVARAQALLEATDLSIDEVASLAGFGTPTSLRQHLLAEIGVSPSAYRRTFGSGRRPD